MVTQNLPTLSLIISCIMPDLCCKLYASLFVRVFFVMLLTDKNTDRHTDKQTNGNDHVTFAIVTGNGTQLYNFIKKCYETHRIFIWALLQ